MATRDEILEEISEAEKILIIQGENPDGDSLASALALEEILESADKQVVLYCAVDMPRHLRFLSGWDRVTNELPSNFDLTLIVDTSSESLLERTLTDSQTPILRSRPMVILDHHDMEGTIPFHTLQLESSISSSTGELIQYLFGESDYSISLNAKKLLTTSIMFDTRGLTTDSATAETIRLVADYVESGVSLSELDDNRLLMNKRDLDITQLKGRLLERIEVFEDVGLASVDISWDEIEAYSDRYNPSILVLDEMRLINGVDIAIAYKTYPDGKILAKIRSNRNAPYAAELATIFGGGGHPNAAGFKLRGDDFNSVKLNVQAELKKIREQANA
jgi:phosphoesterase RecJ-like protein